MSSGPLVVVGDALLDVDLVGPAPRLSPDAGVPVIEVDRVNLRPGGAGLAAVLAVGHERDVVLVAPVGTDPAAELLRAALPAEVRLVAVPAVGGTVCKVRVADRSSQRVRLDLGCGRADPVRGHPATAAAITAVVGAGAVLVSDYGRGTSAHPDLRRALGAAAGRVPVVWDPHPRGAEPIRGCRLVTPNAVEAAASADVGVADPAVAAAALTRRWGAPVVVTLGERGAVLVDVGSDPRWITPPPAGGDGPADQDGLVDPCGAGDRFAVAVALALAEGRSGAEAVRCGVDQASVFVRTGGAARHGRPGAIATVLPLLSTGDRVGADRVGG